MATALVIVHLSSLDSYTWHEGSAAGFALACRIADAIRHHQGPVIIVDQGWSFSGETSAPRQDLLVRIEDREGLVAWIAFDEEADDDWDEFIVDLRRELEVHDIDRVIVGGIWYDPKLQRGCATEVYLRLRPWFRTMVDPRLVGCEP